MKEIYEWKCKVRQITFFLENALKKKTTNIVV